MEVYRLLKHQPENELRSQKRLLYRTLRTQLSSRQSNSDSGDVPQVSLPIPALPSLPVPANAGVAEEVQPAKDKDISASLSSDVPNALPVAANISSEKDLDTAQDNAADAEGDVAKALEAVADAAANQIEMSTKDDEDLKADDVQMNFADFTGENDYAVDESGSSRKKDKSMKKKKKSKKKKKNKKRKQDYDSKDYIPEDLAKSDAPSGNSQQQRKKSKTAVTAQMMQADFYKLRQHETKESEKVQNSAPNPTSKGANSSTYGIPASQLALVKNTLEKARKTQTSPIAAPVDSVGAIDKPEEALSRSRGASVASKEEVKEGGLAKEETDPLQQKRPQKRARVRKRIPGSSSSSGLNLSKPDTTVTNWNASEVIKGFLYVGAGRDQNSRCLVNRPGDAMELKAERLKWCRTHNMSYVLNMAGSPLQKELEGITYPLIESKVMKIEMNDVDFWTGEDMHAGFEKGAKFIEDAWQANKAIRKRNNRELAPTHPQMRAIPPTIFVHCVAGVNRSPMVVVWWLCKYHGLHIDDAWELVRTRRDSGAHWTDITLGGPSPPADFKPNIALYQHADATRQFQHPIENSSAGKKEDGQNDVVSEVKNNGSDDAAKNVPKTASSGNKSPVEKLKYPKALWYEHAKKFLMPFCKKQEASEGPAPAKKQKPEAEGAVSSALMNANPGVSASTE